MFFDDYDFILNNNFVHNWAYFGKYFSQNLIAGAGKLSNYWRPVLMIVFSLEWHLWKTWVVGYHLVNLGLHIADAILLFYLLEKLIKVRWVSLIVAILFLIHPIQTEAVTYVNSLGDSLSVFFLLIGFHYYLRYRSRNEKRYINLFWSLVAYCFGIMSKETAVVLSALIFVADFLLIDQTDTFFKKIFHVLKQTWMYFGITLIYLLLRGSVLNFQNSFNFLKTPGGYGLTQNQILYGNSFVVRGYTFLSTLPKYFKLIFWPIQLIYERSAAVVTSFHGINVYFGAALLSGLLVAAVLSYKKFPVIAFGLFWFFITLSPTSNVFVPINGIMYEHWLYLPLVGIFISVIWLFWKLFKDNYRLFLALNALLLIMIIFFGIRTVVRNRDWHTAFNFYTKTLAANPNDTKIILNLAVMHAERHEFDQAEELYKRGLVLNPNDANYYFDLGNTYNAEEKLDLATQAYIKTLELDPTYQSGYEMLFGIYLQEKKYKEIDLLLNRWLELTFLSTGEKVNIYVLLGKTAVQQNDFDSAIQYLDEALLLDPNSATVKDLVNKAHYLKDNPQAK